MTQQSLSSQAWSEEPRHQRPFAKAGFSVVALPTFRAGSLILGLSSVLLLVGRLVASLASPD